MFRRALIGLLLSALAPLVAACGAGEAEAPAGPPLATASAPATTEREPMPADEPGSQRATAPATAADTPCQCAWRPFDDDDAMDWAAGLEDGGWQAVRLALAEVAQARDAYVELPAASAAVAAAQVVAAAGDGELSDLPPDVVAWLDHAPPPPPALRPLARRAVQRARSDSELQALWHETGDPSFERAMGRLLARIADPV